MSFRFKQFEIEDANSTLRVGTDAMLLGAWANPSGSRNILDIGTGCGILSLMMAQQSHARIVSIDIDLPSIKEANSNFLKCPWSDKIMAIHTSLQELANNKKDSFDFILTNPPYHTNSLKSPSERKNKTRHNDGLTLEELVRFVNVLLSDDGRFTLILPEGPAKNCHVLCSEARLHLVRRMFVHPKPTFPAIRVLQEFSRHPVQVVMDSDLEILDSTGKFSDSYFNLTSSFHNF